MATTSSLVRARKQHRCDDGKCIIRPGQDYARLVAFPGDDSNNGDWPWVLRLCVPCATQYGRELPPRRRKPNDSGPGGTS